MKVNPASSSHELTEERTSFLRDCATGNITAVVEDIEVRVLDDGYGRVQVLANGEHETALTRLGGERLRDALTIALGTYGERSQRTPVQRRDQRD